MKTTFPDLQYATQQRFFAKMLNSISHSPHQEYKTQQRTSPACNICKHPDADIEHILYHCPHSDLQATRAQLENAIIDILNPKRNLHTLVTDHPDILTVHMRNSQFSGENLLNTSRYPHAIDLREEMTVHILEALPESRWYRKSHTHPDTVTVQDPYARHVMGHERNRTTPKHHRLNTKVFWKLLDWHHMTQGMPLPLQNYDKRAHDIWTAIEDAQTTSGHPSLCYATQRTLLDILIDEIGCKRELFSNILNTYERFESRCMLQQNAPFAEKAKIKINGLSMHSFCGNVYGNPPYDGNLTLSNTVTQTLNMAEQICDGHHAFRGTFLLPLTSDKLRSRLANPNATLLFRFPNNTLPFIPDAYWNGKSKQNIGCYNQKHTNIVILLYENKDNTSTFKKVNLDAIYEKLAHWFICMTPKPTTLDADTLHATGVPFHFFAKAWASPFPSDWKFWGPLIPQPYHYSYAGATHDLHEPSHKNPFLDVRNWDRQAAALGILPGTFKSFIKAISASRASANQVLDAVSINMRTYAAKIFKKYWRLDEMQICETAKKRRHCATTTDNNTHTDEALLPPDPP